MKTIKSAFVYNLGIFYLLLSIAIGADARDDSVSKSFKWNYIVNSGATISLSNYDCDLTITSSTGNNVVFELFIDAEAEDKEDLDDLVNYLENLKYSSSSSNVRLNTTFWDSRNSKGNNSMRMKLKNGTTINLKEIKIKANLKLPKNVHFELNSKYSSITMEDVQQLVLDSYDDDISGESVAGKVDIKAKYSEMNFHKLGPCKFDIYDSKINAEKAENVKIQSKYSEITIGAIANLDVESYEDDLKFETTGDVKMNAKYSDFQSQTSGKLTLSIYDSDFNIDEIHELSISESKYAGYTFQQSGAVDVLQSYDDVFKISELPSLEVNNSKYSDYIFKDLGKYFEIEEGYDDNITIQKTSSSFSHFEMNSKYGKVNLKIPDNVPLKIDWKTKHGNLDVDETQVKTKIKIKESSEFEYIGYRGGESDSSPFIKIRGYDVKLKLTE